MNHQQIAQILISNTDWGKATAACRATFCTLMRDKQYGQDETRQAFYFFYRELA